MINMRPVRILIGSAAAALALTVLALGDGAESGNQNANNHIYPPDSKPFGMTYGEWSGAWWQWALSIPAQVTPFLDPDGAQCGTLQLGSVWFLAGTSGPLSSATRACSIPSGRAILIPIMNFFNDYPCPEPPAFQPAPGQSIEAFLAQGAAAITDQIDVLEAELDGKPVVNLTAFRARSPLVSFTGAANLSFLDSCITGSPQLGVSDGYWLLLKPLSRGNHTLHIKGAISSRSMTTEATYNLTIESR